MILETEEHRKHNSSGDCGQSWVEPAALHQVCGNLLQEVSDSEGVSYHHLWVCDLHLCTSAGTGDVLERLNYILKEDILKYTSLPKLSEDTSQ